MANRVIDSHFHSTYLSDYDFTGIEGIDIGTRCDDLPERFSLLKDYPDILLAAAMGPWECGKSTTKEETDENKYGFRTDCEINSDFEILINNIDIYKPAFIGECGLDYYWQYGTLKQQSDLFEKHFVLAEKLSKKIIIHNREADSDTADAIKRHKTVSGIIHCFSGDPALMKVAIENGYYISFAGNLTFKKNIGLREILKKVPSDRLLFETDSPYLTPVPFRGQPNTPDKVINTYRCAAEVLNIQFEDLCSLVSENYKTLCRLP